jgi:amino acid permease
MVGAALLAGENGAPRLTTLTCSVPLCYVYPAMLHYKACARTWKQKAADIALGVFGVVAALYTTVQTIIVSMATCYSQRR